MVKIELLDLEKQFSSFGVYHRNSTNILIHTIFAWPILFTALVILHFTPALIECPFQCGIGLIPNMGLVLTLIYSAFYVCLDRKAGTLAAFLCLVCWIFSSLLAKNLGFSLAWKVVLVAQIVGWTGQVIGHGVFEPSSVNHLNLTQAFIMAPFFALLEVLQSGFGYEPYPGFTVKVKDNIEMETKSLKEKLM